MLGDEVERALESVGVTPQSIYRWLGVSCGGCKERRDKMNALHAWAVRIAKGKVEKAKEYLERIME